MGAADFQRTPCCGTASFKWKYESRGVLRISRGGDGCGTASSNWKYESQEVLRISKDQDACVGFEIVWACCRVK